MGQNLPVVIELLRVRRETVRRVQISYVLVAFALQ